MSSNYIFFLKTSKLFTTLSLTYDLGKLWYYVECPWAISPFIFALNIPQVLVSKDLQEELKNIDIQYIPLNLSN